MYDYLGFYKSCIYFISNLPVENHCVCRYKLVLQGLLVEFVL